MLNDLILISKVKEGDIKAFEALFRFYYTPLCLYAASISGNMPVAEEIVQDLYYVLWRDRQSLPVFRSLKSYLYRAVRNEALQYCERVGVRMRYREKVREEQLGEAFSDPQKHLEYEELEALVNKTLHKLPERRQKIFRMHRFEGIKYAEIASTLSVSVKTVEAEMTKALKTLRKEIENY